MKPTVHLETTIIGYLATRVSNILRVADDAVLRAESLRTGVPFPDKAAIDALHISIAAVSGIECWLTCNCKHIANPSFRPGSERACRDMGHETPVICTPQELLEIDDGI